MKFKWLISILLLLVPVLGSGKRIYVRDQEDFDRLPAALKAVLESKDTLADIRISPGLYFYREGHLLLADVDRPDLRLRILGEGVVLTAMSTGQDYHLDKGYVDLSERAPVDIRDEVRKAGSWPVPVPFQKGMYMIRCDEPDRTEDEVEGWHIILSQWFKGAVYPVERISKGWLYFIRDKDYGTGMWSELRFGRCLPRYILCHPPVREGLHACGVSNFLTVKDSKLKSISLEGVSFLGNKAGEALVLLDRIASGSVRVAGCSFTGIRSNVICSEGTDHLLVKDCFFKNNYLSGVDVGEGGTDVRIEHNRFLDNGLMMTNAPVVHCVAKDYLIGSNYFEDFAYSAIGVGIHYTQPDHYGTTGVVEKNEICMSAAFRRGVQRALIDAGAIYISTVNARTVIRDNHVHDILGPHGNRGIFADDGAVNVEICGNRVFHIWNGYCIDFRRCFRVGRKPRSKVARPNVGNKIHDNVCDGRMRLFVRKDDPDSYISNNTVIKSM